MKLIALSVLVICLASSCYAHEKRGQKELAEIGRVTLDVGGKIVGLLQMVKGPIAGVVTWLADNLGQLANSLLRILGTLAEVVGSYSGDAALGKSIKFHLDAVAGVILPKAKSLGTSGGVLVNKAIDKIAEIINTKGAAMKG